MLALLRSCLPFCFAASCSAEVLVAQPAALGALGPREQGRPPPPPSAITFDSTLDDHAVLQQTPSEAYVYGTVLLSESVSVKVSGDGCASLTAKATVFNHTWKAKVPGTKGGDCTIVASDDKGNSANLTSVTYGDVWYCGGQSNMALPLAHTFSRNASIKAIKAGQYSNIRLKQMESNMNPAFKWMTVKDAVDTRLVAEHGKVNSTYFPLFSATCYYFGESLTEELGADAPPIGLIHTAYGGSMIEQVQPQHLAASCALRTACLVCTTLSLSRAHPLAAAHLLLFAYGWCAWLQWLTESTVQSCHNASNYTAVDGGEWWEQRVLPYSQMTLKGWTW
jgi:hypothetical protein